MIDVFNRDNICVIDVESTGLAPEKNEIIEVGLVKIIKGEIVEEYSTLIKPSQEISYNIRKLTGISNDMLKDAPKFIDVVDTVMNFIGDSNLLGHNTDFDISILNAELERHGYSRISPTKLDTIDLFSIIEPGYKSYKLSFIAKNYLDIHDGFHRALEDARITAILFLKCISEIELMSESLKQTIYYALMLDEENTKKHIDDFVKNNLHRKKQLPKDFTHQNISTKNTYNRYKIKKILSSDLDNVIRVKSSNHQLDMLIKFLEEVSNENKKALICSTTKDSYCIHEAIEEHKELHKSYCYYGSNTFLCLKNYISDLLKLIKQKKIDKIYQILPMLTWYEQTVTGNMKELHSKCFMGNKKYAVNNSCCNKCTDKYCYSHFKNMAYQKSNIVLIDYKALAQHRLKVEFDNVFLFNETIINLNMLNKTKEYYIDKQLKSLNSLIKYEADHITDFKKIHNQISKLPAYVRKLNNNPVVFYENYKRVHIAIDTINSKHNNRNIRRFLKRSQRFLSIFNDYLHSKENIELNKDKKGYYLNIIPDFFNILKYLKVKRNQISFFYSKPPESLKSKKYYLYQPILTGKKKATINDLSSKNALKSDKKLMILKRVIFDTQDTVVICGSTYHAEKVFRRLKRISDNICLIDRDSDRKLKKNIVITTYSNLAYINRSYQKVILFDRPHINTDIVNIKKVKEFKDTCMHIISESCISLSGENETNIINISYSNKSYFDKSIFNIS